MDRVSIIRKFFREETGGWFKEEPEFVQYSRRCQKCQRYCFLLTIGYVVRGRNPLSEDSEVENLRCGPCFVSEYDSVSGLKARSTSARLMIATQVRGTIFLCADSSPLPLAELNHPVPVQVDGILQEIYDRYARFLRLDSTNTNTKRTDLCMAQRVGG